MDHEETEKDYSLTASGACTARESTPRVTTQTCERTAVGGQPMGTGGQPTKFRQ